MKTRYKPFVAGLLVVMTGQQLQAQNPNSLSDPLLQASAKDQSPNSGKTLDGVRESMRAKRKQTGPKASKGAAGLDGGEGAAEGGMSGSSAGSKGGGLSGGSMSMGSGSGMMSSGGSSMGMSGGISLGSEGGASGMNGPFSEKQKLIQLIQQLRERLKSKKYKREDVEKLLRSVLADYFQLDMEERVGEFDKVKARIAEMESKLQNRLDRQKEIIELQTLQILHKADGLDFVIPESESGSGFGSMGPGIAIPGSWGAGMSGPGMGSSAGGGGDDLSRSGSGGLGIGAVGPSGSLGGGELGAESFAPVLGYDIGFGTTKYLRVENDPTDPLVSYKSMKGTSPGATTSSTEEKMKSILNAMHEFHAVFQHLPGAVNRHVKGQPPHSWRVALLPLLGHSDLYREYRFDEPWDSQSNSKLIAKMPNVYSDTDSDSHQTNSTFFVITGEETAFPLDRPTSMADITDGTSNTIGLVRAKRDIPWTKPEDIAGQKDACNVLSAGGFVGFIDGSVFKIRQKVSDLELLEMITRAGGEPIYMDRYRLSESPR